MSEDNPASHSSVDGKAVSDAIAEFIVMDLQLPEVVEGRGFQRLVATLKSPCEIPSKNKLEDEIIPKVYESFRESVAANLACIVGEFGLAVEEWRSNSGENYVTLSVYYQSTDEAVLECKVLSTMHAPLDWGEAQWGSVIDSTLLDWEMRIEKITAAVVATSRHELLQALAVRGLALVPCLLHTLQVCARACFENPDVAHILAKCRTAIGVIASHATASSTLNMQEQMSEVRVDVSTKSCSLLKYYLFSHLYINHFIRIKRIVTKFMHTIMIIKFLLSLILFSIQILLNFLFMILYGLSRLGQTWYIKKIMYTLDFFNFFCLYFILFLIYFTVGRECHGHRLSTSVDVDVQHAGANGDEAAHSCSHTGKHGGYRSRIDRTDERTMENNGRSRERS